jgi:hypothetical protein
VARVAGHTDAAKLIVANIHPRSSQIEIAVGSAVSNDEKSASIHIAAPAISSMPLRPTRRRLITA